MKKTAIGIAVLTIVLAALCVILILMPDGGEDPLPEALQELDRVFAFEYPVRTIVIEQAGADPFVLADTSDDPEKIEGMLKGREDLPVDTAKISAVLRAAGNLPYTQLVLEEPDDYKAFGLDPYAARVSITTAGGESAVVLIGDIAADGTGRYVRLEGAPAIYLVPVYTLDNYFLSEYNYLSHTVTPSAGYPINFERMVLTGGGREGDIEIVPTGEEGYFSLSVSVTQPLDPTRGYLAMSAVFGMEAGNISRIYLTEEDLADLGLDNPWATVTVESESLGDFTVRATAPDVDGHVFLYRDGVPVLYTAEASALEWLTINWFDLISKTYAPPLSEIASLDVAQGGSVYIKDCVVEGEGEERTLSATVFYGVERLGELEYENFERFYETLVGVNFLEPADGQPPHTWPQITARFNLKNGETHTVEYYTSTQARRWLVQLDDGPYYYVTEEYVSALINALTALVSGQIVPTYLG